jgi:serine/threonine-protein kinase
MNCPVCAAPLEGEPKFCPRCGSSTDSVKSATAIAPATEAEPRFDPFLGTTVGGRYKITRLLGEGGMGAVYLGEQNIGGTVRKVAIKTLHAHLSKDPKVLQRFERECATVAELQHPNTIQLYDFGKTDDGILYMVMEFVQGESLAAILEKQGAIEPARSLHILQQICDALGEAHTLGIVHRDLKPENIVLTERAKDWVKVLDFGIAKRTEAQDKSEQRLTQQGTVLGTPPYMSPEQFTGKPIDARSDLYSIGVIAYEMLAGRLPFSAATPWEWAHLHMTAAPAPLGLTPSGAPVPDAMAQAVMRTLAKDPNDRFGTTREFYEAMSSPVQGVASGGFAMAPASMLAGFVAPQTGGTGAVGALSSPLSAAPYPAVAPVPGTEVPTTERRGGTQIGEPTGAGVAIEANALVAGAAPPLAPAVTAPPRRGRGGGPMIAAIAVGSLVAAGGVVFALTHTRSAAGGKSHPASSAKPTADDGDAGGEPGPIVTNDTPSRTHLPPLIDTSLPSLPTNVDPSSGKARHADAGSSAIPSNDPHSCKAARTLQQKIAQTPSPTPKMLAAFNTARTKCIGEGGHL